ncbi:MAG TPA: D-alanine--D-alanine ligase [Candidatus Aquicultor sp.]
MSKKVAVLMGGRSAEREISLLTGEQIYNALILKGYDTVKVELNERVGQTLLALKPAVVFIALHGRFGEDGTVQGMLEILDLPYTGSGVLASAIGINKAISKRIFESAGITTPRFSVISKQAYSLSTDMLTEAMREVGLPVVVKPVCEGSTIGMSIVDNEGELAGAIETAFLYDDEVVLEQFVTGTEITVGILGNEPQALPTLEVETTTGFYDYKTKYTAGLSKHIIPARIPEEQQQQAQEMAIKAHNAIGCRGFSRVDIIVGGDGTPYVLEINTIPGMTNLSLFPDAARAGGYEFPELVSYIVELALDGRA